MEDITGWTLREAREYLRSTYADDRLRLVETAPPSRPSRQKPSAQKPSAPPRHSKKTGPPEIHLGEWRVLRCHVLADEAAVADESAAVEVVELIVAREQLAAPTVTESSSPLTDSNV